MKIIGGHDYYDGAGLGVDSEVVFVRTARRFAPGDHPFELPPSMRSSSWKLYVKYFHVLIAGEVHPGIQEVHASDYLWSRGRYQWVPERKVHHYSLDAALASVDALVESGRLPSSTRLLRSAGSWRAEMTDHFQRPSTPAMIEWMVTEQIKTGIVIRDGNHRPEPGDVVDADIATLKDWEVYKIIDPATAHMRLSNWIGGVLPSSRPTVEISDQDRIRKAGVDVQASFRTPKGDYKPRRRRR